MRWDDLRLDDDAPQTGACDAALSPALFAQGAVTRRFEAPQFRGMTFYEVRAKSIINRVPDASRMPFRWTVNPYRGCSHACVYCFARSTHAYLDLDPGRGFDSEVVVKVNAAELLRSELARPRWTGEHVAMGTNVDCYQRAEGRYRLMPGIIAALRDAANPFSILTKGSLVLRDLPLLAEAAGVTDVHVNVSVGFVGDDALWRSLEPGTPSPQRRLEACHALNEAGVPCGVLMAPIVPGLTDAPEQLEATVRAIAGAGATAVTPLVLHLRPGAREWFGEWLAANRPGLLPRYRELYGRGSYAPAAYQDEVTALVRRFAADHGLAGRPAARSRGALRPRPTRATVAELQPALPFE
ncbi:MAG: Rv2578c family radical SAM protein [Frankiaceae bacterium]